MTSETKAPGAVEAGKWGTATPYLYDLDFNSMASAGLSTRTYGASWEGKAKAGEWKLPYRVELAQQDDTADNPTGVDAAYLNLELKAQHERVTFAAAYEVLEGDPAEGAFNTPLATLHKFNGWADKFLTTPSNGLRDLSLTVSYAWEGLTAALTYHDFAADSAGADHGSEIDAVVSYKADWGQLFGAKAALFAAETGGGYTDTDKFWVWTGYSF